jgi:hypothetical protein
MHRRQEAGHLLAAVAGRDPPRALRQPALKGVGLDVVGRLTMVDKEDLRHDGRCAPRSSRLALAPGADMLLRI